MRRRLRGAIALLAALVIGPLAAACGGPERAVRYHDPDGGVTFSYDGDQFAPGTLAASDLIDAAERAVGGAPVSVVEIVARGPGAEATGLRVAVFETPSDVTSLGFWRATQGSLDGCLSRARTALAPAVTIGEPFRVTVAGLQGYAAVLAVEQSAMDGEGTTGGDAVAGGEGAAAAGPAAGIGLALSRPPHIYEVVVLCRPADRRLLDELTQMLVGLRLGGGPPLATP